MIAPFTLDDAHKIEPWGTLTNKKDFFSIYMKLMNPHLVISNPPYEPYLFEISEHRADQIRDRVYRALGDPECQNA